MANVWSKWGASSAPGYSGEYYLNKHSDIMGGYRSWLGQADMNFGHYVRSNPDLENEVQRQWSLTKLPQDRISRVNWGRWHWDTHGRGEAGRRMAYNVSPGLFIMSHGSGDRQAAKDFGAWHYIHGGGKGGGYYGNESEFYNSPGEVKKRQDIKDAKEAELIKQQQLRDENRAARTALLSKQAADEEAALANQMAQARESVSLSSRRGGGSQTQASAGTASLKGKGLKPDSRRGRRGTSRFRRAYESSGLSIAAAAVGEGVHNK